MTVAHPGSIHPVVNVDEADIANVGVGQKARIFAIAYPELPVEGIVDSIGVSAKVATGQQGQSFAVKIRLVDPEKITLRPGMTCRAEIFTATQNDVIATPIQAIQVEEDLSAGKSERHVFVVRGSRAARVNVEVGLSDDMYQEVKTGLADTDDVIVGPDRVLRALKDGDRVVVRKKAEK
jgi:HlyD family secretion protein